MLYCSNCSHIILYNDLKECEICFNTDITYIDSSLIFCPENILFPKENEKGFIPILSINYDQNKKLLDILFSHLKNKHIISEIIDIYVNNYCIGRINLGIASLLNTSLTFQCLNPKNATVNAVLPDRNKAYFWKIEYKP